MSNIKSTVYGWRGYAIHQKGGVRMERTRGRAKRWKAAAAGGFLCAAVAACGMLPGRWTIKKETSGGERETVLTVTYASGDEGWNRAVSMAGEAFSKEYPDIHLELRPSTRAQGGFYDDFLRKQAATDDLGDIVELKNTRESVVTQMFTPMPKELTEPGQGSVEDAGRFGLYPSLLPVGAGDHLQ